MASYNGDFNRMQEEALARLREMQKRSRTAVNRPGDSQNSQNRQNTEKPTGQQSGERQQNSAPQGFNQERRNQTDNRPEPRRDALSALLGDIRIDSEKVLILLMLFVLYKNKADIKLILALGYLLI